MHSAFTTKPKPSRRSLATACLTCFGLSSGLLAPEVRAQGTCQCVTPQPFGSCIEKQAAYPDLFPGAALLVPVAGKPTLIVADLFNGFTYRYDAARFESAKPTKAASPKGSNATTGLAYRQVGTEFTLFWAIEDKIYSTNLDGGSVQERGAVQLERLALFLRDLTGDQGIAKGSLGGITNHGSRGTLWGVDIVNDVYFEFSDKGELALDGEGKPIFFFNPMRNKLTGGAYGNAISYVESGGREYFDIPVGTLADRRPSAVHRVHASNGAPPETFKIGDSSGIFYPLGTSLGSPEFVTGISFWPNSCAAGQSSEIILNLDSVGGAPKILQVSADEPNAAAIASFECASLAATEVTLTWRKTRPYTSLKITRQLHTKANSPSVTVFENADFANDPQRFVDSGLLDGSYEYTAAVTAASAVPSVTCRATVGVGSLAAFHRFTGNGKTTDPVPYAITVVDSQSVLVADINTGDAQEFDINLMPTGKVLVGPVSGGLTVGLAWNSDSNQLYWLENDNGHHLLHVTDLAGARIGNAATVDSPASIVGPVELGDLSYDTVVNYFWTVDLLNEAVYGITTLGAIPPEFKSSQIKNPETGGILSGGIAVAAGDDKNVTLDIPIGMKSAGIVDQIGRFEYTRGSFATKKEIRRLDLRSTTGASDFGGIEIAEKGPDKFEFVVGLDTRAVYKLKLTSETSSIPTFRRGDVNNDGSLNISDPSFLLSTLFKGGPDPACKTAADVDDSGKLDISDAVNLFNYLFKGGTAPSPPFSSCGVDLSSPLNCDSATCVDA